MIDFDKINQTALVSLRSLVPRWIPGGRFEGEEYVVKNPRRPDKHAGSFKINVKTGVWSDFACQDIGGGDPVSLYAYICNFKMGEAALALAKELNIIIEDPGSRKPAATWSAIVPVPEAAPDPPKVYPKKIDKQWIEIPIKKYYTYRTKDGQLAGYTCLVKYEDGSKEVVPLTYCKAGDKKEWKFRSFKIPRPIYKLDKLIKNKDAQVLIVEGEKCADAAEELFKDYNNIVVISWIGGGKGVSSIKWDALRGRKIILWPDADSQRYKENHERAGEIMDFVDQPGAATMIKIYNLTKKKIKGARLVKPPRQFLNGWDIADAVENNWDLKKIIKFIQDHLIKLDKVSQKPASALRTPFQCLGYNSYGGQIVYYYLPIGTHKVTALTANGHSKMNLLSLAPVQYFEREYPTKGGADYVAAANDAIRQCEKVGIYDPLRCRGRGAWFDKGRTVLHMGNKLIVDGAEYNIDEIKSYYIYEAEIPTEESASFISETLSAQDASKVIDISNLLSWENKISSKLFAGWIMLAPICGAIEWRPHIWLTGESSTGKSWIQDNIISQILGKTVLNASANSTEAGIRQSLKNDAFPVRFDEVETEDKDSFLRVQKIIELARQSSSNRAASIIKGSAGGKALSYCIRSCFMFSSINPKLYQQADESRITILKLIRRADYEEGNQFDILREVVIDTLTDEYCQKLRSRAIKLIPVIRKNIEIFSAVMSKILKSKRHGDQNGSLLAGCYALKSDKVISIDKARAWAESVDWLTETTIDDKPDQERCLDIILQQIVRIDSGNKTEAIGSLIRKAAKVAALKDSIETTNQIENDRADAREALRKYGITTVKNRDSQVYDIAIAENHSLLKQLLINTPWNNGYKLVLMRHKGAAIKTAVFADKRRSSSIVIPYNEIFTDDLTDEEEEIADRF